MTEGVDIEQGWVNTNTGEHGHFEDGKEICDGIDLKIVKDQIERMKPTVVFMDTIGWYRRGGFWKGVNIFYMCCGSCKQETELNHIPGKGTCIKCQHCKILNRHAMSTNDIVERLNL